MAQKNSPSTDCDQYLSNRRLQVKLGDTLYTFQVDQARMAKYRNHIKECDVYKDAEFVLFCHHALLCQIKDKQIKKFTINNRKYVLFNCDLYLIGTNQAMYGMIHITTDINGQDIMNLLLFVNKRNATTKLGIKSNEMPLSSIESECVKEKLIPPIVPDSIKCIAIRAFKDNKDCIEWVIVRKVRTSLGSQYIFGIDKYQCNEDFNIKQIIVAGWIGECFDSHLWPNELSDIIAEYLSHCWRLCGEDVSLDDICFANRLFGLKSKLVLQTRLILAVHDIQDIMCLM